jgi:hypothetical protein
MKFKNIRGYGYKKIENFENYKLLPWRINLSLKKYTFCGDWTKIVAQS